MSREPASTAASHGHPLRRPSPPALRGPLVLSRCCCCSLVLRHPIAREDASAGRAAGRSFLPAFRLRVFIPDPDQLEHEAVRWNVRASVDHLRLGSAMLRQLGREGRLRVAGAEYSLATGAVEFLDEAALPPGSTAPGGPGGSGSASGHR